VQKIRKRITFSNVIAMMALFVALGGSAYAATQLKKNSVGTKQIKSNAVTAAKLKKNAVTGAKIATGAVTGAKVANGSLTGAKINLSTLGTVPSAGNSATTSVVKGSHGKLTVGQEATAFEYAPFKITVKCAVYNTNEVAATTYISSSAENSVFMSWAKGSNKLGPATPEEERVIGKPEWNNSNGPFEYDGPSDVNVSALAPSGQSFNAYVGLASEKETNSCWYSLNANITG
jgi:hypothetical protein